VVALVVSLFVDIDSVLIVIIFLNVFFIAFRVLAWLQGAFSVELAIHFGIEARLRRAHFIKFLFVCLIGILLKNLFLLFLEMLIL
jgi:hypothetical protein